MYYKKFKGQEISALGMGCLRLPLVEGSNVQIDREKAKQVIDAAFDHGINYFDTAYTYQDGDSERALGELLSGHPRDSYYLTTKYYAAAGLRPEEMFEEQLRRCRTDYFDFYLLHGVSEVHMPAYMNPELDCINFFLKQKEAGRIRHMGFSSHAKPEGLRKFLDWYDGFDMAMIQLNYLDWTMLKAKEQYEILTEHGLPVWVMEPLKGGRLATLNDAACAILKAAAPERTVASWGMRWLMGLPNVQTVLSGMTTLEQMEDNLRTFQSHDPLSPEEEKVLEQAIGAFRKELGVPCSECRYCCSTCPAELNIPLLIKGFNEYRLTGGTWRVEGFSSAAGPEYCLQCGTCLEHCPQRIDIPGVMRQFADLRAAAKK